MLLASSLALGCAWPKLLIHEARDDGQDGKGTEPREDRNRQWVPAHTRQDLREAGWLGGLGGGSGATNGRGRSRTGCWEGGRRKGGLWDGTSSYRGAWFGR
jgi:hypothetical protein